MRVPLRSTQINYNLIDIDERSDHRPLRQPSSARAAQGVLDRLCDQHLHLSVDPDGLSTSEGGGGLEVGPDAGQTRGRSRARD